MVITYEKFMKLSDDDRLYIIFASDITPEIRDFLTGKIDRCYQCPICKGLTVDKVCKKCASLESEYNTNYML
jgi:hypothetical protein